MPLSKSMIEAVEILARALGREPDEVVATALGRNVVSACEAMAAFALMGRKAPPAKPAPASAPKPATKGAKLSKGLRSYWANLTPAARAARIEAIRRGQRKAAAARKGKAKPAGKPATAAASGTSPE